MSWQARSEGGHSHSADGGHAGHGGGRQPGHFLADGEGATVELWLPTLERRSLQQSGDGTVAVRPTGMDYYHALVARRGDETAVTYVAMRGKPSGISPSELIDAPKARLEIVPAPYAREHQRYYSGGEAVFQVRFDGKPLAGKTVGLETSNGTRLFMNADPAGRIALPLPEDFSDVEPGRRANAPAEFLVETAHAGHRFALTAPYYVNPGHWQSEQGGLLSGLAGFLFGFLFLKWSGRSRPGGAA